MNYWKIPKNSERPMESPGRKITVYLLIHLGQLLAKSTLKEQAERAEPGPFSRPRLRLFYMLFHTKNTIEREGAFLIYSR